ncbi:DUF402 domain-containing protein [Streptacidiphilus jiangxiensis]|uniref:DUF402 domain-containing protein n=1 Tax=Streptacidiphilus jiangxiensis TaxID=235985 RepID=A0A1H8AFH6_STRJI|nr:DUF402 domain-containing protein [Streptacidiphilus jiangxiensis]SEM68287.1 Protein of unknown function [Streptacidiphilus jiangxiensis]
MERFEPGETVVRRDLFRGRVWSATALRVVEDTDQALVTACRPGAEAMASRTYVQSRATGDDADRKQAIPDLAAGSWELAPWHWQQTVLLMWKPPAAWYSVNAFFDPGPGHELLRWYVNFERPMVRTAEGFDTFDLLLDLVVAADLSTWEWKDVDEFELGCRLGVVDAEDRRQVEAATTEVLKLIEKRGGPFTPSSGWATWRSDPSWPATVLPSGAN